MGSFKGIDGKLYEVRESPNPNHLEIWTDGQAFGSFGVDDDGNVLFSKPQNEVIGDVIARFLEVRKKLSPFGVKP
jgi:hypothetical protein